MGTHFQEKHVGKGTSKSVKVSEKGRQKASFSGTEQSF